MRFQYDESRFKNAPVKSFQCLKCKAIFDVKNPALKEDTIPPMPGLMGVVPQKQILFSLAFLTGSKSSTSVELHSAKTIIGRDDGDIVTMDPETSQSHAMLEILEDGTIWLEDLGSTNGTFTNGSAISTRIQLSHQQEFTCGKSAFMILIEEN